jgi:hypothetical protein
MLAKINRLVDHHTQDAVGREELIDRATLQPVQQLAVVPNLFRWNDHHPTAMQRTHSEPFRPAFASPIRNSRMALPS